jgi:hypothetical protein
MNFWIGNPRKLQLEQLEAGASDERVKDKAT